jgi:hypothetical protein
MVCLDMEFSCSTRSSSTMNHVSSFHEDHFGLG